MYIRTAADRRERRTRRKPWHGVILFALGVIALSNIEFGLVMHAHDSTAGDDFALASDLAPVLREGIRDASANGSDALDKRSVIPVTSQDKNAYPDARG